MTRPSRIFLIGARGSGKTTVGRLLAERLSYGWCDVDVLLEERAGKTIRQIFEQEGEAGFREREAALLQEIAGWTDHVVATGGGIVLRPANRALLKRGTVIWLTAPAELLWQRMQGDASTAERRPNLGPGGLVEMKQVVSQRAPLYERCADGKFDTEGRTPAEVAEAILARLG